MTTLRNAAIALAATVLMLVASTAQALASSDSPQDPSSAEAALAKQLERSDDGVVAGNKIYYPDGSVFVAVDVSTMSLGQCSSGQFCIWTQPSYQGSFIYKTGTGVTRYISGTVGSFWNNRSYTARLYSNTGNSSTCYENGYMRSSVSSGYNSASKVYLSGSTNC
jgi:hypothetical protein